MIFWMRLHRFKAAFERAGISEVLSRRLTSRRPYSTIDIFHNHVLSKPCYHTFAVA